VAIFGRRKPQSFTEFKETMRPTPDADGVTRVFPSELWDDPKVGALLRDAPNHTCMTAAAHDRYFVVDGGDEVVAIWDRVNGW